MVNKQNEAAEPKVAPRRSLGFPTVSLPEAVAGVITAGDNGPVHTRDAFAVYLGHKTANSGAYKMKLAALRDWGLIKRGDPEQVELTSLAIDLAMATSEGRADPELIRKAFYSCTAFAAMYETTAKNVPLLPTRLRTTAMMQYKVPADQADRFVRIFAESAVYAGLATEDGEAIKLSARQPGIGGAAETEADESGLMESSVDVQLVGPGAIGSRIAAVAASPVSVAARAIPAIINQKYKTAHGEVEFVVRSSEPLPADTYASIGKVIMELETLVKKLGPLVVESGADES